jgi:murein DD-endopeptidase MepM/ murein hydrolase activator NlpD
MLRAAVVFLALLFLTSCAPPQTALPLPSISPILIIPSPTSTLLSPTLTPSPFPPTPTFTPIPCNPSVADFCINDGHFLLQRPIHSPANTFVDITYRYGSTANGKRDPHTGVEFVNKFGTPVYAAREGTVIFAGRDSKPVYMPWPNYYGNLIVIEHPEGLNTLYAHLSRILVEEGQKVAAGDPIGEVGQTGVAIGPHLHFEVRRGDVEDESSTENPELWLIPNPDETGVPMGALQLTIMDEAGKLVKPVKYNLEHHPDKNQSADLIYYEATYDKKMLKEKENAGIGDLPAGWYRIKLLYNGYSYERWVEVQSGKLTQAVITVK